MNKVLKILLYIGLLVNLAFWYHSCVFLFAQACNMRSWAEEEFLILWAVTFLIIGSLLKSCNKYISYNFGNFYLFCIYTLFLLTWNLKKSLIGTSVRDAGAGMICNFEDDWIVFTAGYLNLVIAFLSVLVLLYRVGRTFYQKHVHNP